MVVMILERVPEALRGELSRWMLEPKTGVFVGSISAMVRDRLWQRACGAMRGGAGVLVYSTNTEQGFEMRPWGDPSRSVVDMEGLKLVQVHPTSTKTSLKPSIVPTGVGVNRSSARAMEAGTNCPHGRGGEPQERRTSFIPKRLSPRAWG
jgi:CRISPR-associated protein Cas2